MSLRLDYPHIFIPTITIDKFRELYDIDTANT